MAIIQAMAPTFCLFLQIADYLLSSEEQRELDSNILQLLGPHLERLQKQLRAEVW